MLSVATGHGRALVRAVMAVIQDSWFRLQLLKLNVHTGHRRACADADSDPMELAGACTSAF